MKYVSAMTSILLILFVTSCSTKPLILDQNIKAHWMERNETAPFKGILLNDYTYIKMREKIMECK